MSARRDSSGISFTSSSAAIKGWLNKQGNRQRMWELPSWSQSREAVNHNPWAETEFTTPIKTHLGSEATGPTFLLAYRWAPSPFIQSFSFREQKQINESQIHVDNPLRRSKKEIIIFEVMKVLPEVKELLGIFRPVSWSKKNTSRRSLAERQIPQSSFFFGLAPCLLCFTVGHPQGRRNVSLNSETGEKKLLKVL